LPGELARALAPENDPGVAAGASAVLLLAPAAAPAARVRDVVLELRGRTLQLGVAAGPAAGAGAHALALPLRPAPAGLPRTDDAGAEPAASLLVTVDDAGFHVRGATASDAVVLDAGKDATEVGAAWKDSPARALGRHHVFLAVAGGSVDDLARLGDALARAGVQAAFVIAPDAAR
jgi:hypothetical protein